MLQFFAALTFYGVFLICYNARALVATQPERNFFQWRQNIIINLPTGVIINGQALTSAEVLAVARHFAHVTLGAMNRSHVFGRPVL